MLFLVVMVVVLLVVAAVAIVGFNKLQRARQGVAEAWAQVDTQLQRRFDLVGSLNEVVAAATRHERLTMTKVTEARALDQRDRAERTVADAAGQLVATAEAYPNLQTDDNFRRLHQELVRTEDDIAASRRYYNGRVRLLNTERETFPWMLLTSALGIAPAQYFQIDLDEGQAPRVG